MLGGDAGNYRGMLSNAFGSLTSAVASVAVVDPIIAVPPARQAGDVGQTVRLSVTVVGTAPVAYQWWKEPAALPGRTGASLTLTNFQPSDAGNYWVVVSNRWAP